MKLLTQKARWHAEYLALRGAIWLAQRLGIDAASALSGQLLRLIGPLGARHRRAQANLAAALPALSPARRRTICRKMWQNAGRVLGELCVMEALRDDPSRFHFECRALREAAGRGRGVILLSLHSGNWEIAALCAHHLGLPGLAVYQKMTNPLCEAQFRSLRQPLYAEGLLPKGHKTALALHRSLRAGKIVSIMGDLREPSGIFVDFFGRQAWADTRPARLALATDTPIVAVRVLRRGGAYFQISTHHLEITRSGNMRHDAALITRRIHALFERWIGEAPEQWLWMHRKWPGLDRQGRALHEAGNAATAKIKKAVSAPSDVPSASYSRDNRPDNQ